MGCGSSPRRRRPDRGRGKRGAVLEGQVGRCFPERSIDFVLEAAGLGVHDIDLVASGCWKGVDAIETAPRLAEDVADQVARSADPALTGRIVADRLRVSERRDREFRDEFMERVARRGIGEDRIRFYDHHYTHAVSAWSPSGLDDELVLTADGRGDGRSVTLWRATEQGLELLDMATELVSQGAPSLICPQIIEGQPPERVSLVGAGDTLAVIRLMAPVVPVGTGGWLSQSGSPNPPTHSAAVSSSTFSFSVVPSTGVSRLSRILMALLMNTPSGRPAEPGPQRV